MAENEARHAVRQLDLDAITDVCTQRVSGIG